MSPDPGWYRDPLALGRLRLWDGTNWTDQTQPQPPVVSASQAEAERRRRHRRARLIDGITVMVAIAFLVGLIELGWRKSAVPPPTGATATLAVIRRPAAHPGQIISVEVVTAPGVLAEPPGFTRPSILPWTPAPTLPQSTVPAAPDPGPSVPPAAGPGGGASSRRFSSSPHDYTLTGYQWKPCQPITVSSDGPDVSAIVAELASITGLSLQLVNGPANIMVGWGPMPIAHAIGVTEGTAYGTFFAHVTITLAPRGASSLPSLLRHELGHALGLGHTDQPNEIMYPVLRSDSPNDYQAGDRAGLQFIGTSATSC